jgi:hypothetical protein
MRHKKKLRRDTRNKKIAVHDKLRDMYVQNGPFPIENDVNPVLTWK